MAAADITITDNGSGGLIVASTSTDTIQDGTNLGTGTALFSSKDATTHALQFKSIVAGAGLTLTDDGAGTLTLVNDIAAGTTDADLTLSNLSNVATARTNLDVYSKAEGNAKYHRTDANFLPATNNIYDVGSPTFKFNDIYAETFQGTAVLADQLTISGTSGQVLTHNGSEWVAGAGSSALSSASDMSNVAPADGQHLVWEQTTGLWTPSSHNAGGGGYQDSDARGAISVAGDLSYNSTTGVITFTQNDAWSNITGTPTTVAGYGITDAFDGAFASLSGKPTTVAGYGITDSLSASSSANLTNKTGSNSQWTNDAGYLTSVPAQTFASLTGKPTTISGYGITDAFDSSSAFPYSNLTGTPTIPSGNQIIDWTADQGGTNIHAGNYTDTNTTYTAGSGLTLTGTEFSLTAAHFDGAYGSLTGAPTTVSSFTNDANYLSSVPAQAFSSLIDVASAGASEDNMVLYYDHGTTSFKWKSTGAHFDGVFASLSSKPTTLAGYGITDGGGTYVSSDFTHDDLSGFVTNEHIDWTTDQGATNIHAGNYTDTNTTYSNLSEFTNDSGYITSTGLLSSHTDVHTSAPSNGDVLKWDAGNSRWHAQADSVGSVTATSTTAFTNKSGNISQWTNDAGYITSETDSQTLSLSGTTLSISTGNNVDLGALTLDDFADVNITSVADGQFLTYDNGAGDWTNSTVSIPTLTSQLTNDAGFITSASTYDNSDVDTHLNQSNPTSGYVLSWNGSDYAWVSNGASGAHFTTADARSSISGTTGLSYNSTTGVMTLNSEISGLSNVSSTAPSSGQILKWSGSEWAPAADTDTDTIYTSFSSDFDTRLAAKSTTDLSEGSNKYFTDGRARAAISATGSLSYNASTGVISYTEPTMYDNISVNTHLNVSGATTGQILSWTGTDYDWIANSGTPAWTAITGKPTTIAGFGITDAFDGLYSSLGGKPTTIAGYGITDAVTPTSTNVFTNKQGNISQWTNNTGYLTSVPAQTFSSLTGKPTTIAGYGITDAFDGAYGSLSGAPTIPSGNQIIDWTSSGAGTIHASNYTDTVYANSDVDSHLNQSNPTSGYVLSWNGSDYSWIAQSGGGGATDKIEEGNSSVEVIDGGANGHVMFNTNGTDRWQVTNGGHILPEADATYDLGSADKKVRHLFLSDNSLYIEDNTIKTSGTNLLFNDEDVMDYDNLKNTPTAQTAGTGIQINSGVISLNSTLSGLSDVHTTAPTDGQVLKWDNSNSRWAPGTDLTSGSSAMNDLSDVDTSGISTGQYLKWDGSNFVASTVTAGASSIDALTDVDTTTSAPSNGDVLTWVQADSEWAPAAPAGGGGGSGATIEYFKLNYATSGDLTSITNTTSGVSATITSATGGDS